MVEGVQQGPVLVGTFFTPCATDRAQARAKHPGPGTSRPTTEG